jgi:hypothetical protein
MGIKVYNSDPPEMVNTSKNRLIGSKPHSHNPFAPTLVFLSQVDRL